MNDLDPSPPTDNTTLRQTQRLADAPALYRQAHERLALELALRPDDPTAVFAESGIDPEQAQELLRQPAFALLLTKVEKEVRENGISYRMKARAIAEETLNHAFELATDPFVSAAVRASLIQWFPKMGGLEPKETKDDGKTGGGLTLSITFAGQAPQQVVTGLQSREPITIEGNEE